MMQFQEKVLPLQQVLRKKLNDRLIKTFFDYKF